MAVEVEDDVFFADLSKQLALLIMDDEEEFPAQCPLLPAQELPYMPQIMMPPSYGYEVSFKRESKGTGVFIPQSTAPRRKNRSRRQTTVDSHPRRQLNKSAIVVSHVTKSCNIHPSHYSHSKGNNTLLPTGIVHVRRGPIIISFNPLQ
ncbi:hypothetical protein BHE74_00039581 [Ensete ventricosum]|uniref:Uncharacterized protein n=1 Tax=Ensete ventricosum TaxID=4639 RepID=A0A444F8A0_ENSVE|nr:hypothetical protein B296_00033355 [Ensete ventricosum]RWW18870.1 hypothetical protein GW17_00017114 [Ensete ventricosum]RWW53877.1 hypothetical protein BHE74_00039581 [Ensete ventricosum]